MQSLILGLLFNDLLSQYPMDSVLIVPIKDPSSLSKAMEEFIHQKQKIIEMGKSARIKAQKEFDINLVSSAHMSLYNTLSNISKDG